MKEEIDYKKLMLEEIEGIREGIQRIRKAVKTQRENAKLQKELNKDK